MKKSYPCLFTSNFILTCLLLCCCFSVFGEAPSVFETESNVSLACETAPPIQCPSTFFGCPGASLDPAVTGFATAQPGDADCPTPIMTYSDLEMTVGPCAGETFVKRVWTASYPGNTDPWLLSDCTQKIEIEDIQDPTIACPNDIVVATNCHAISWPDAGTGDNCGIASLTSTVPSGSSFGVGTTPVTYTAVDNCGNTIACTFNVTVEGECCGAPPITCPADYVGCIAAPVVRSETGYATSNGSDACGDALVTFSDITLSEGPCKGEFVLSRTWTATSQATGLTSSCVQSITAVDDTAPTIANCPANITVPPGPTCVATWSIPVANDDCGIDSFSGTHSSGSSFGDGTTTVTYTAVDQCGNTSACSFTVTCNISCSTAPSIACPADFNGCISSDISPSITGQATSPAGAGNCQNAVITYTDATVSSGPCAGAAHIQRTWVATEPGSGLTATCVQNIYLADAVAPVITSCASNITLPVNEYIATWTVPTATDNCGQITWTSTHNLGDTLTVGTTTVTYTATDGCGNATSCSFSVVVTETCTTAPAITCPGDYISCLSSSTNPSVTGIATAVATGPNCATPTVTYEDATVAGSCAGEVVITRKWIATGSGTGMISTCFQTITLEDTQAPTIANCPANITLAPNAACTPTWISPVATDDCGLASFSSNFTSGQTLPMGETTVTYTATDNCGKTSSCSFTVTCSEACVDAPVITCPANYTTCADAAFDPSVAGSATAVAASNLCSTPVITYSDVSSPRSCDGAFDVTRTWVATDPSTGLTSSCVQTIVRTYFSGGPTITNCPANIVVPIGGSNTPSWVLPTATQNCGIKSLVSSHNPGDVFPCGITTVTYTATDKCDRVSTCSFTVTITCPAPCNTAPVISCPANYTTCADAAFDPSVAGTATAVAGADNCGTPTITFSDVSTPRQCDGAFDVTRTWVATDPSSGLSSSCVQTIVRTYFSGGPTITNCPADIVIAVGGTNTPTWVIPTATQNCGIKSLVSTHNPGDAFPCGTTTVTYTATDKCDRVSTCSFTVTINCQAVCNTVPTVSCPANYTACPGTNIDPAVIGKASASNPAVSCGVPSLTFNDVVLQTFACTGGQEIQRTWTASNGSLSANCVQNITLNETSGPTLTNCPADITTANATVTWTPPTISSGCGGYTLTSSHNPGDAFACGPTTVTYSTQDACGNVQSCSFVVTVVCNDGSGSGFNNCPTDVIVDCNSGSNVSWDIPQFTSSCSNTCDTDTIAGYVYMGSFGGSKYFCSLSPSTWPEANANAQAIGGNLAVVTSAEENAYLANILTIQSAFIGCSDGIVEGDFIWTDGTPVSYTNWYPGQPNNYQNYQDYCEMLSNGQWNDQYNHVKLEYIVELSCNSVVQTQGPTPGSVFAPGSTTVEYRATDGCGNVEVCSFEVIVSGGLQLDCIPDQFVECPSNAGVQVTWQEPQATTCCGDCNSSNPGPIAGFIYMGSLGSSHYYCSNDPALWADAQSTSLANGGHLAVINDAVENAYLANLLTIQSAYIGLSDSGTEGTFQWVDGSGLGYNNWYPGQPNDYQAYQDYVELLASGEWNDQYNNKPLEYIMEIPAGCLNVVQTAGPSNGSVLAPGTHTISYQATDGCGNSSTCTFDIVVSKTGGNSGYCTSQGNNSSYSWIEKCTFGPINNASGNNGGYQSFDGCHNFNKGGYYSLKLTPGYAITPETVYWSCYVDYNQDGDFTDAGEYIATGNGTQTLSGTIVIPSHAATGQTRLRVIMKKHSVVANSCSSFAFGEVEDYCINILPSTSNLVSINPSNTVSTTKRAQTASLHEDAEAEYRDDETAEDFSAIEIYPNPATDILYIRSASVQEVNLFDAQGRLVKSAAFTSGSDKNSLEVSELHTGVYTLQLRTESGEVTAKKVAIHRP